MAAVHIPFGDRASGRTSKGVPTLVLTGTIGTGKTTIAETISELLHERGVRHALIDLDWLGQVYPPLDADDPFDLSLALRNLTVTWPNFLAVGIERAVIAATIESPEQLRHMESALPGAEPVLARVVADQGTVAARIRKRELGGLAVDFLARTEALGTAIAAAFPDAQVVTNDGPILEAASEAIRQIGW